MLKNAAPCSAADWLRADANWHFPSPFTNHMRRCCSAVFKLWSVGCLGAIDTPGGFPSFMLNGIGGPT